MTDPYVPSGAPAAPSTESSGCYDDGGSDGDYHGGYYGGYYGGYGSGCGSGYDISHDGGRMPPAVGADTVATGYGFQQPPAYPAPMVPSRPPVPRIEVGDAVKWAWSKTFANPLIIAWIPLSLLVMVLVLTGVIELIGEENEALSVAIGVPSVLVSMLIMVMGLNSAALRIARGDKVTFRSLIAPPNGFDAAAALVLVGLTNVIASLFPFGGMVASYFFWVTVMVAMNEGCSCFKAMGRSCRLMAQGGNALLLALMLLLIYVVGMLTVIGLLVAIPMIFLLTAYVYMRMSGGDVAR